MKQISFFLQSLSFLAVIFFGPLCIAHPVTYKGGTAITYTSRTMMGIIEANHSLTNRWAIGGGYQRLELVDGSLLQNALTQANGLVKRSNNKEWQANLYLSGGAGYFRQTALRQSAPDSLDQKEGLIKKVGLQADWESRSYYLALMHNHQDLDGKSLPMSTLRFGIAPYHADYSELQAWLIWQVDHAPDMFTSTQHTPIIRFFYRNVLWEIGSSFEGIWWLQLMSHF